MMSDLRSFENHFVFLEVGHGGIPLLATFLPQTCLAFPILRYFDLRLQTSFLKILYTKSLRAGHIRMIMTELMSLGLMCHQTLWQYVLVNNI